MGTTPEGETVELRVHGVSGGTAEKILDHPIVDRVAGDSHAGFYRPRPGAGPAGGASAGITVEAYRWGALTAGTAVRTASMLLLLPFMLSNLAIRLRPTPTDRSALFAVLCRLLAGTLTAAFVLSVVGVTLDLVAWQCVPYHRCRDARPYLSWLHALPMGPRLALLALVPLFALRVTWRLGARSARAFEGFGTPPSRPQPFRVNESLSLPGFWDDERTPAWLRRIHVAIGAGTLDASLLAGTSPAEGVAGQILFVAALALLACCAVLLCLPVPATRRKVRLVLRPLSAAAAVVTLLSLGHAALARDIHLLPGQLPGYEGTVGGLMAAQGLLLVVLALVAMTPRAPGSRPFLAGLGMPVVAAASVTVAGAFAAALVFRVADFLDRGSVPGPIRPDPSDAAPLDPPVAYWWAALAGLAALVIATTSASLTFLATRRRRRCDAARIVARDYPDVPAQEANRRDEVRETIARSRVVEELGPILITFLVMSSLGLATIAFDLIGIGPTQLVDKVSADPQHTTLLTAYVTDGGVWLISLLVIGLMILAFRSYRSAQTRRTVAALWDLGDFWPRTVHPFAPPCYAARAVPELARRVTALGARGKVVISGHSHGSVLAAATILQLPPEALRRVALLTHGSPLSRFYTRLYPAYLGRQTLCDLGDRLDWRWRNLWRDTDPVGGPIFDRPEGRPAACDAPETRSVDVRLRDPSSLTVAPEDTVPPPLERHWPYHTRTAYQTAARDLAARIG
ncbi:hypothetical protein [Micromonospora sp. AMSO31t]|uniref:hypothetical protein n=1 Tax=Micromonospora sp. AMSO31t TaxID=2650566 RepID=UPI00124B8E3F|nr:hypothetical protein [Micromonospora sp. AMSO31t]KAB1913592.1 hypothetical protein F8274_10030 [Micromonospora sp. AMSO31t]